MNFLPPLPAVGPDGVPSSLLLKCAAELATSFNPFVLSDVILRYTFKYRSLSDVNLRRRIIVLISRIIESLRHKLYG